MKKILVTGSLAYDHIMDFPGEFKDHILPDKVHILNVCFSINEIQTKHGGTAGNIAYNLALLGENPTILSAVGKDFDFSRLESLGVDATSLQKCYLPFYRIETKKKTKLVDAMGYSLELDT